MTNAAITTSKQGRNSWSFDYRDPRGGCMQVALVGGKTKARRVLAFVSTANLDGMYWEDVASLISDFRRDNRLTVSDPHPRGKAA